MEKHGTSSINTLQMEVFLSLNITENLRVSMEVSFLADKKGPSWEDPRSMEVQKGGKWWEKHGKKSM
jgi:hypothetical protein